MNNLVIACDNLKIEVNYILKKFDLKADIVWIDSKYHNTPNALHDNLQKNIDNNQSYENIVLLYGYCGNAINGLKSNFSNIIYPRVDDCISLYLGGNEARKNILNNKSTYFFTKSLFENKQSLYNEIEIMKDKYGVKKAIKIYKEILKNYTDIKIIDTGSCDISEIIQKSEELAEEFGLTCSVITGDLSIIYDALAGNWNEKFVINKKSETINLMD